MRHLGKVCYQVTTLNIFSNPDCQGMLNAGCSLRSQHVSERNSLPIGVRYLNADSALTWDWGQNTNFAGSHRVADVINQPCYSFDLHPRCQFNFVSSHSWPTLEIGHPGLNIELFENLVDGRNHLIVHRGFRFVGCTCRKQTKRRKHIGSFCSF